MAAAKKMRRSVTIRLPDRISTDSAKVANEALRVAAELINLAREVRTWRDDIEMTERLERMVAAWEHRTEKGVEERRIEIMQKLDAFVAAPFIDDDIAEKAAGDPAWNLGMNASEEAISVWPMKYLAPDGLYATWTSEETTRWYRDLIAPLVRAWKNDAPGAKRTDDAPGKYVLLARALKLLGDDVSPKRLEKLRYEYKAAEGKRAAE